MSSVAKEYRKRVRNGSGVSVAVAFGVGAVCVGGIAGGVWWANQPRHDRAIPRLETRVILPDAFRSRASLVKEATAAALAKRGVEAVIDESQLVTCDDGSCLLTGACVKDGLPTVYVSRCSKVDGRWRVVSLRLPIDEAFAELQKAVDEAERQFEEAGR
jgi:hypothetical protein